MINVLGRFLARPAVVDWLIRRATSTPYFHLTGPDGTVYMERYWLFNPYPAKSDGARRRWGNWLPSVRLHRIMRPDSDLHLHDHPWNARTFILRGWYREERPWGIAGAWVPTYPVVRNKGDTATLRFGEYHRIDEVSPGGVWTLFITWRHRGTWGFLVAGHKVPWREYLGIEEEKTNDLNQGAVEAKCSTFLPCPMPDCGSDLVGTGRRPCGVDTVSCGRCGLSVPSTDEATAIERWNRRRATAPAARQAIDTTK
jgi:hypothetical protein